jgi:hypothetical protein
LSRAGCQLPAASCRLPAAGCWVLGVGFVMHVVFLVDCCCVPFAVAPLSLRLLVPRLGHAVFRCLVPAVDCVGL